MQGDYNRIVESASRGIEPVLLLFIFAFVVLGTLRLVGGGSRHRGGNRRRGPQRDGGYWRHQPRHDALPGKVLDAADQLRTVMQADFTPQPLLNKSEARLFKAIDRMVLDARPNWQVMAQVSLGEILRCKDKAAYGCINSKRVDLLIVDEECRPLHAIEYQGGAHYMGAHATAARDAVKKEALRRAGIGYVEVVGGEMNGAELRRLVERLVADVRKPA